MPGGEPVTGSDGWPLKTERAAGVEALRALGNMGWYSNHRSFLNTI